MQLICGINPVLEALSAGTRHFDRLLVVKGLRNRRVSEAIARASHRGIPLRFESRETLDRMAGGVAHQGLIAMVSAKPVMGLEEVLDEARQPGLLVVLDGVEDPRNLGAILRTAEAAGVDGVLLPERHSAGLSETVARASAGGLEHVRLARLGNVSQAIEALKERGYWIVGFDGTASERWDAVDYRRPVALVLGGEGRGIRRLVRERCDHLVSIPLFGHVSSLNVSVAAGIALYEAVRQRGAVPSHVRPIPERPTAPVQSIVAPGPEDNESDPGRHPISAPPDDLDDMADEHPSAPLVQIDEGDEWSGPQMVRSKVRVRRVQGEGHGRQGRRRGPQRGGRSQGWASGKPGSRPSARDRGGEAGSDAPPPRSQDDRAGEGAPEFISAAPKGHGRDGSPPEDPSPVQPAGEPYIAARPLDRDPERRRRRRRRKGRGPGGPAPGHPRGERHAPRSAGSEPGSGDPGGEGGAGPERPAGPAAGDPADGGERRRKRRRHRKR